MTRGMSSRVQEPGNEVILGYAEGYYGRLPSWQERHDLLQVMADNAQNTYYYAPKEDACHRLDWRAPYDDVWREEFRRFTQRATELGIRVVAGVAPGLDFDFAQIENGPDFRCVLGKCRQLLDDGAHELSLLMDDIDADFAMRCGDMTSEGQAHAVLANRLRELLSRDLWVTPRIYANELAGSCPDYLPDFLQALHDSQTVLYCGSDIVARHADCRTILQVAPPSAHRLVLWDNLYANDYCPQRLFVGPWTGREAVRHCLLNPTGMPATDHLLLDLMACMCDANNAVMAQEMMESEAPSGNGNVSSAAYQLWCDVLSRHGVPDSFRLLAPYFDYPVFNGEELDAPVEPTEAMLDAIETCLWRWKSPLSREWYPFLFNLKLDLLQQQGRLSELRTRKTRSAPLALCLRDPG